MEEEYVSPPNHPQRISDLELLEYKRDLLKRLRVLYEKEDPKKTRDRYKRLIIATHGRENLSSGDKTEML